MTSIKSNKCRRLRAWLYTTINSRFGPDSDWLQNHIANCTRCQRRFVSCGKVNLALSLMKSQPHRLDLLMRANKKAIGVLKHSLRRAPKAHELKTKLPEPKLLEKWGSYGSSAASLAACITILLLMKIGVFSSMHKFQIHGQNAIKQYYARHVGEDIADEIFPKDIEQRSSKNSRGFIAT